MKKSVFKPSVVSDGAGVMYSLITQAFLLKLPQILWISCALALCLVYQNLLEKSKSMTQGDTRKEGSRRQKIVYTCIVLLFALTLPGALNKDNLMLTTIGNLTFLGASLILIIAGQPVRDFLQNYTFSVSSAPHCIA